MDSLHRSTLSAASLSRRALHAHRKYSYMCRTLADVSGCVCVYGHWNASTAPICRAMRACVPECSSVRLHECVCVLECVLTSVFYQQHSIIIYECPHFIGLCANNIGSAPQASEIESTIRSTLKTIPHVVHLRIDMCACVCVCLSCGCVGGAHLVSHNCHISTRLQRRLCTLMCTLSRFAYLSVRCADLSIRLPAFAAALRGIDCQRLC